MTWSFKPGDRVVCVGCEGTKKPAGFWEGWRKFWGITNPVRGETYTIRDVRGSADGGVRVRLVEIVNPVIKYVDAADQEPWWFGQAFRPVRTTSIEALKAHLNVIPARKSEEA